MSTLSPVDESTEPFLSGRYAPVHDEIDVADLSVDGTLPTDITGAYLRNGPNPKFPPLGSYTYPLEGDGMLHGVWFEGGRARYANRFVRTNSLKAEETAGTAIFGGLMTPAFVDQSLLGPDPDPTWPFKLDADINIVRHAGHLLALGEGVQPVRGHRRPGHAGPLRLRRRPARRDHRPPQDRPGHRGDVRVPLRRHRAVPHVGRDRRRWHRHPDADRRRRASTPPP